MRTVKGVRVKGSSRASTHRSQDGMGHMRSTTRVTLAQQAYLAALQAARAHSTPRTWARLLRAAQNLRDASSEVRHARGGRRER